MCVLVRGLPWLSGFWPAPRSSYPTESLRVPWQIWRLVGTCGVCSFGMSFLFSAYWRFSLREVSSLQAGSGWGEGRERPGEAGARGEPLHFA